MFALLAATGLILSHPNVVVIFSDDHARAAISAYGSKLIRTPSIDALAASGIRFDRHYTANPICAPSRASLLTGKHSHLNGHRDNNDTFNGNQQTLPKLFKAAGYETAVIGKWHLVSKPIGFDHWEILPGQGSYYNPDFNTPEGTVRVPGYCTDIITEKAKGWLRQQGDKPFFLLVGHKAPHRSWEPGPQDLERFSKTKFPEPPTLHTDYKGLASGAARAQMRLETLRVKEDLMIGYSSPRMTPSQKEAWEKAYKSQDEAYKREAKSGDLRSVNYQRYLREYLRCVAAVDRSVSSIMAELEQDGLLKNTIVVYASDQGFFLGENGWYDKRWFYEPSAGTPLIICPIGGSKPRAVEAVTSNVDVAPTLLHLAGLLVPADMQGRSLVPALSGALENEPAYGHFYESEDGDHNVAKYVALVDRSFKIVYYYELREWELFDLQVDPTESKSLFDDPRYRSLRRRLALKLVHRQEELQEERALIAEVRREVERL